MKYLILATIIWRVTGIVDPASGQVVPQAEIQCEQSHKDWCGMRFWDCSTGFKYECVTNVEILKEVKPVPKPLTEEERQRIRDNADKVWP